MSVQRSTAFNGTDYINTMAAPQKNTDLRYRPTVYKSRVRVCLCLCLCLCSFFVCECVIHILLQTILPFLNSLLSYAILRRIYSFSILKLCENYIVLLKQLIQTFFFICIFCLIMLILCARYDYRFYFFISLFYILILSCYMLHFLFVSLIVDEKT